SPAAAFVLLIRHTACSPDESWSSPQRISASACVNGRKRATHVRPTGIAVIGKSEPARNHGAIAIAGTLAMYSSWRGILLASVSAAPYIAIVSSTPAATNQRTPAPCG